MPHKFGGPWTEIKLDAVEYYLECYTKALSHIFDLYYIDAFAGTGDRTEEREIGGILEGTPLEIVTETLDGSAKRALNVDPPFHHFLFNEIDRDRLLALETLKINNIGRDIRVYCGEANATLRQIFADRAWARRARGRARGVVFLDPYALQVDWSTLELLAATEAVDVWYLFPLRDVTRQLAILRSGIGPKEGRLDRVLSPAWRQLYSLPPTEPQPWQQADLFGVQPDSAEEERNATQKQIEAWFRGQLEGIFKYASEPLPLLTGATRQAFSLFLCIANPSGKAIDLAKHFHRHVMRNFGPAASRRTSGP